MTAADTRTTAPARVSARRKARRTTPTIVGVFVLVLISLQIFLFMVGLEAVITHDPRIAWVTALTSVALAACAAFLYRYLRRPLR
jgi:uncharacterized YccA/Bax inhibitor family protein